VKSILISFKYSLGFSLASGLFSVSFLAQASVQPMGFSSQEFCADGACEQLIIANGLIERDSSKKLEKLLEGSPLAATVEINSLGGDLPGALQLGETIRSKGLNTRVRFDIPVGSKDSKGLKPAQCYSACLMAFMGGVTRTVSPQARIGFHGLQPPNSSADSGFSLRALIGGSRSDNGASRSKENGPNENASAVLTRYIERMGVDRRVLDIIITAPSGGSISFIDGVRAKQLSIDNRPLENLAPWRVSATKSGALVSTVTVAQRSNQVAITLGLARVEQALRLIVHIKPTNGEFVKNPAALEAVLQPVASVRIQSAGFISTPKTVRGWERVRDGYQLWAELPQTDVEKLSEVPQFVLILDGTRRGIDRDTTFGTSGLRNYLAALRKNS
jgi:hypothetical protein